MLQLPWGTELSPSPPCPIPPDVGCWKTRPHPMLMFCVSWEVPVTGLPGRKIHFYQLYFILWKMAHHPGVCASPCSCPSSWWESNVSDGGVVHQGPRGRAGVSLGTCVCCLGMCCPVKQVLLSLTGLYCAFLYQQRELILQRHSRKWEGAGGSLGETRGQVLRRAQKSVMDNTSSRCSAQDK